MSENRAKVIAAAIAAHAALESLILELTEELKEEQGPPAQTLTQAPPLEPAAPCQHENKEDLRTFGTAEAWRCKDCGFEFRR